jgi:rare lipoprotein A (peptidoglycan hydrolase)
MEISMRAFLAAAAAAFAIVGGASLPAEAFTGAGLRDGVVGDRSAEASRETTGGARLHLARAMADDDDDEDARPARRWHSERWDRPRYAQPRHVRPPHRAAQRHQAVRRAAYRTARHDVGSARRAAAVQPVAAGGMTGMASFYGGQFHGRRTASGMRFDSNGMTAAHRTLPFGTRVRVTHLGNGRSVEVRINDRGPYVGGRIIDLSRGAAGVLGMQGQGVARVKMTVLGR